ncbi:hypothetical protein [Spirulina subsalsa]|uniref:hypothetical protein n=1 Tax=Spirulina subsalsa TaxID=54311 RepID=UPI00037FF6EF|nr:hypothetical protein [Spirulina subsalsa]
MIKWQTYRGYMSLDTSDPNQITKILLEGEGKEFLEQRLAEGWYGRYGHLYHDHARAIDLLAAITLSPGDFAFPKIVEGQEILEKYDSRKKYDSAPRSSQEEYRTY